MFARDTRDFRGRPVPGLPRLQRSIGTELRQGGDLRPLAARQFRCIGARDRGKLARARGDHEHVCAFVRLAHAIEPPVLSQSRRIEIEDFAVHLDAHDRMIEGRRAGKKLSGRLAPQRIEQHRFARDAQRLQQADQQKRLVLAVAVAPLQDDIRSGRPMRAFAEGYGKVAYFRLDEFQCRGDALFVSRQAAQFFDDLLKLVVGHVVGLKQIIRPTHHVVPPGKFRELHHAKRRIIRGTNRSMTVSGIDFSSKRRLRIPSWADPPARAALRAYRR